VQGDSVAAGAAFLLDAARADVSARTVVQVLQHWVDDGMSHEQVRHALAVADESCPLRHRALFTRFRLAIADHFSLSENG
jgi:hypothetical protein